jgi:hypothetical protein
MLKKVGIVPEYRKTEVVLSGQVHWRSASVYVPLIQVSITLNETQIVSSSRTNRAIKF